MKVFNGLVLLAVVLFGSFKVDSNSITPKKLNLIGISDKVYAIARDSGKVDTIPVRDIAKFVGKNVDVRGQAFDYRHVGNSIEVYLGGAYPNHLLTLIITGSLKERVAEMEDNFLMVTGKVTVGNKKPQIFVTDEKQVRILRRQ